MKYLNCICCVSLLLTIGFSPAFCQQTWTKTFGGDSSDVGLSVQQTEDGGYIIAGGTMSFGVGQGDVYIVKTDAMGDTLWTRAYGGTENDGAYAIQITSSGGFIIAGGTMSYGPGTPANSNFYLIRTDSLGDTIWTRTYGGEGNEYSTGVQQTSDGGYIAVGLTESFSPGNYDVYLIKTDSSGDTLWTRRYGGGSYDGGTAVLQNDDGGYVIAGSTQSFGLGAPAYSNVYLVKADSLGDTLWTRTYGGDQDDGGQSVQQTWDGGYIISGDTKSYGSGTPSYYNAYLIKTDSLGDTVWTKTYGGVRNDYGYSVRQTSDGGYIMAGRFSTATNSNAYLVKVGPTGDTTWARTYGGSDADWARAVRQTADDGYIVAGQTSSYGAGSWDIYLIKTNAEGNVGVTGRQVGDTQPRMPYSAKPNPFSTFLTVPHHENAQFEVYDVTGKKVGTYKGSKIGNDLLSGIYFMKPRGENKAVTKVVKLR